MAIHSQRGAVGVYFFRPLGPWTPTWMKILTPEWLDAAQGRLARRIDRRLGRMGLLGSTWVLEDGSRWGAQ